MERRCRSCAAAAAAAAASASVSEAEEEAKEEVEEEEVAEQEVEEEVEEEEEEEEEEEVEEEVEVRRSKLSWRVAHVFSVVARYDPDVRLQRQFRENLCSRPGCTAARGSRSVISR
jgi:signal recognition particle GTPase